MKDHKIAELVNQIRAELEPICANQSLRARISKVVTDFFKPDASPLIQSTDSSNAIYLLDEVRLELHKMANKLENYGLLWAAQEIRIRHTPRIWQVAQKNFKQNVETKQSPKWRPMPYDINGVKLWGVENRYGIVERYCNSLNDAQDKCDELNI